MQYEIRAMSLGEILDTGLRLLRNHFVPLVGTAALLYVPFSLVAALVLETPDPEAAPDEALGFAAAAISLGAVAMLLAPIVMAAVTRMLGEIYLGRSLGANDAFRGAFSILLPLMGTFVLAGLAVLAGLLLLVIPGIYLMLAFFVITPVIVLEGVYGPRALGRSRELMRGSLLRALAIYVVALLLSNVLGFGVGLAVGWIPLVGPISTGIVQATAFVYTTSTAVLLYFDARCRKEAFDLEHLARQVEHGGRATPDVVA